MADKESTIRTIFAIDGHTQYKDAIKGINSEQTLLRSEMSKINADYQLNGDKIQYNQGKVENLSKQIDLQKKKVDEAKNAVAQSTQKYGEGSTETNRYTKELNYAEAQLMRLEKQLKGATRELKLAESATYQAGQKMQETGKKWQKSGDKMASVGKKLTLGVTTPIAAIGTVAAKSAIDFETGMAGVRKTTDMTTEELEDMSQALRDMSKEIPVSVTELTTLTETAGQLGIEKENLVDFTRVMADLGVASNIAGQDGATAMAQFANITKMAQTDFDRMGSSIVELGNNTATTEKDILNMATRLASAGHQANMSEADILGIAAGLASLGLEAQAGGSAFSKVINNIQLEVDTGGDKLEDFARVAGMSAGEFSTAWGENAAEALSKFIVGLGDTERHGKSTNEILDELGITELRMGDALRRTSGASELFNETLKMSNRAWEDNNALTNEASILYETTESKLQLAKNELNDAAIDLGQNLLPVITDVAGWAAELVGKFTELPEETQGVIIKMGGLAAALGPVLTIGGNVKKVFGKISSGIGGIVSAAGEASATGSGLSGFIGQLSSGAKAGLVGAGIAGAAALVGLIQKLTEIPPEIKKVNEAFDSAQENSSALVAAYQVQTEQIDALKNELYALAEIEGKSAEEKARMEEVVRRLNQLMPDLNLEYDKEADKLSMVKGEIENVIAASKERMQEEVKNKIIQELYEAQAVALGEIAKEETKLHLLKESQDAIQEAMQKAKLAGLTEEQILFAGASEEQLAYAGVVMALSEEQQLALDGVTAAVEGQTAIYEHATGESTKHWTTTGAALQDLGVEIGNTEKLLPGLKDAFDANSEASEKWVGALGDSLDFEIGYKNTVVENTGVIEESHQKMNGVYQETADTVVLTEEQKTQAKEDGLTAQEKVASGEEKLLEDEQKRLEQYQRDLETATSKNLGLFGQFSEERIDISKTSAKEFNKHLEAEITAFSNWHNNLQTIAELTNPETAEYLAGFGPQAAGLIEDYVKEGMGGELAKLPGLVSAQGHLAEQAAWDSTSKLYGYGQDRGKQFGNGLTQGLADREAAVRRAAGNLVSVIDVRAREVMRTGSPSKVAMDRGHDWGDGLVVGMEDTRRDVGKASAALTETITGAALPTLDPFTAPLPSLSRMSTGDGGYAPVMAGAQTHTENNTDNRLTVHVAVPTGETEDFGRRVGLAIAGQLQNRAVSLGL